MPKTQGKNLRLYASVATNSIRSKFEAVALDATCEANASSELSKSFGFGRVGSQSLGKSSDLPGD